MSNSKIRKLFDEATFEPDRVVYGMYHPYIPMQIVGEDTRLSITDKQIDKFAELIVAEAFRAGILYSAKKYLEVIQERFTGNDVSMFLEMEAVELTDDEIKQHFRIE